VIADAFNDAAGRPSRRSASLITTRWEWNASVLPTTRISESHSTSRGRTISLAGNLAIVCGGSRDDAAGEPPSSRRGTFRREMLNILESSFFFVYVLSTFGW
jgi:hypothetical protein